MQAELTLLCARVQLATAEEQRTAAAARKEAAEQRVQELMVAEQALRTNMQQKDEALTEQV